MTKPQLKLLLLTFYSFNCPKILWHVFTGETLLFKWRVVLRSQMMYFWRCFPLTSPFLWRLMSSSKGKKFKILQRNQMLVKLPKQPLNVTRERLLCVANCSKWPLKALSEGQNQDGGPSAKIRIELN